MSNSLIVALSVDKVQSFLFETIHAHVQEKQTEAATLKNIMNSSREISIDFFKAVKKEFSESEITELLSCSGVFIFECFLPKDTVEKKLNNLFLSYYRGSQGQKQLKYTVFPSEGYDSIEAIQKAKKRLKQAGCLNAVIEKNRDTLFSFQPVIPLAPAYKENADEYPMFAENINALFCPDEADNENRFRIAVIKADLDKMGDMFRKITDYDTYHKISETLNEYISLKGLHRAAEACRPDRRSAWLFPFYIAGDDIFFAVSVSNLIKGVDVCRQIAQDMNAQLRAMSSSRISVSIGVEITFNRQPIRYYADMVEKQLIHAKKTLCPEALNAFLQTKISIGGLTFFDIDLDRKKKAKAEFKNRSSEKTAVSKAEINEPIWQYFLHDIKLISRIKSCSAYKEKIGTPSFFYSLLEKITDETSQDNHVKYMNNLLYHLLPEYLDSPDTELRNLELLLKTSIIRQLYQKSDSKDHKGDYIALNCATKYRIETYLRFMLLFSNPRFNISEAANQGSNHVFCEEDIDKIRKYLLTKPMDYLYNDLLRGDVRGFFANRIIYHMKKDGKPIYKNGKPLSIPCFQLLHIKKSMFFKIRNTCKVSADKAAEMVALNNTASKAEIDEVNEARLKAGKAPYHLYFDKNNFYRIAKTSGKWTSDYVDSLMLFYEYNEMNIKFKGYYCKMKEGGASNAKHG